MTFRTLADREDKGGRKKKEKKIGGGLGWWRVCVCVCGKLFLGKDAQVKPLTFQISRNN